MWLRSREAGWAARLLFLLAGLFCAYRGQRFLDLGAPYGYDYWPKGARWLLLSALLFASLAWERPSFPPLARRTRFIIVALLIIIAAAVRLPALGTMPPGFYYDEIYNLHDATRIAFGGEHFAFSPGNNGRPAFFLYQIAALFRLFGFDPSAARFVPALSGVLAVFALYLLARRMLGEEPALLAAALLALSRWHVNFSRVLFAGIQATLLPALAFYFLWRGIEACEGKARRALPHFALAGLCLGLTMHAYGAARAAIPVALAFVIFMLATRHMRPRSSAPGLAALVAVGLLVFAPMGGYMLQHPDEYGKRAAQVSLLGDAPEGTITQAAGRTLGMFNYIGDGNARHNLPRERMLPFTLAMLLPAALLVTLLNVHRPAYLLALAWLLAFLLPGALTTDAPHALRTLGALPAVLLVLGDFLARMARFLAQPLGSYARPAAALLMLFFAAWVGAAEMARYFTVQMKSPETWEHFEARYVVAADAIREIARDYDASIHTTGAHDLSLRTLLYGSGIEPAPLRQPADLLVVSPAHDHAFVIARPKTNNDFIALLAHYYPDAATRIIRNPFDEPDLVGVFVPGEMVQRGLPPAVAGTLPLRTPHVARFRTDGEVWIDGERVVAGVDVPLAEGLHCVRVRGASEVAWSTPWTNGRFVPLADYVVPRPLPEHGLVRQLFDRPEWVPPMDRQSVSMQLDYQWVDVPRDSRAFSMRWLGELIVPASGEYEITLCADGDGRVVLNGESILDVADARGEPRSVTLPLGAGTCPLMIEYSTADGSSFLRLSWRPPGGEEEVIPNGSLLLPPDYR